MNRALGHLCAHIDQTGPGEPPEYGEMNEMTLFFRHMIQNSSPGGLSFTRGWGSKIYLSFKSPRPGTEPPTLA